ncbi:vam6 vps39-like protein [Lasius niger]|uniref:Vam6 vps39-like protein n=1 Tax=Lasius niger TaxID=67767 RepID=A0A0J7KI74_LASNI|nr:vam6 vps39-like protein [Lasius niger]
MKWGTTSYSDFVNYLPIFPSVRTLQRAVEHIQFESGILDEVFDMLKHAVKGVSENERDCMIVADEMVIKAGLVFDPSTKRIIGKCTFPTHVEPTKKVLVIMCGGINRRWKVVVAYFFTGKKDPKIKNKKANNRGIALKDVILKVIDKYKKIGLKASITTDMGSENRSMWNAFSVGCIRESDAVVSIQHSVRPEDRFYFLPDPVHLFKNILTMLESNKIIHLLITFLSLKN